MAKEVMTRRRFIKLGAAAGGLAVALSEWIGSAFANRHPHPRPTSIKYLDRNMYRKNTDVLAHFEPGEEHGGKMQMMAIGERRWSAPAPGFISSFRLRWGNQFSNRLPSSNGPCRD